MADCTQDFRDIRSTVCSYSVSDLKSRRSAVLRGIRGKNYRAIGQLLVAPGCPESFEQAASASPPVDARRVPNLLGGGAVIFTEQAHLSFSDSVDLTRCRDVGPKPSHVGGGASRGASR